MSIILQAINQAFTQAELPNHQLLKGDSGEYIAIWPPRRIPDQTTPFLAILEHDHHPATACSHTTNLRPPLNQNAANSTGLIHRHQDTLRLTTYASLWIKNAQTGLPGGTPLATDSHYHQYQSADPDLITKLLLIIVPLQAAVPITRPTPQYQAMPWIP